MVQRVDPDFDPTESQVEEATRILAAAARIPTVHYKTANGNGFQKWMLAVTAGLAITAVGGGILMFGKLSALEAQAADTKGDVADVKRDVNEVKLILLGSKTRPR